MWNATRLRSTLANDAGDIERHLLAGARRNRISLGVLLGARARRARRDAPDGDGGRRGAGRGDAGAQRRLVWLRGVDGQLREAGDLGGAGSTGGLAPRPLAGGGPRAVVEHVRV